MSKNTTPPPITDLSIIQKTLLWIEEGHEVALATVVETWGSAPRAVGSQMAIHQNGMFVGSVSGGCVEGEVVTEALAVIRGKKNKEIKYDVSNITAQNAGLACGGKLKIIINWVCAYKKKSLEDLVKLSRNFQPAWLKISTTDGSFQIVSGNKTDAKINTKSFSKSGFISTSPPFKNFIRAFIPNPRLLIVGGVHIAQILSSLGLDAGYEVILIDPRDTWATPERFPGIRINREWPSNAITKLSPDHRTAVVILSHDPKIDDPALTASLKSSAFYIGILGSRKTHSLRIERLLNKGVKKKQVDRIFAPIGLNIKAKSPFEISISIIAQIIEVFQTQGLNT